MSDNIMTKQGYEDLKEKLRRMTVYDLQDIIKEVMVAAAHGDLSENAEYFEAKDAQSFNENRIAELEELLKNAVVIETPSEEDTVRVGSTIEVKSNNGAEIFNIVGSAEAKPQEGKISNESPLGRAFLGQKIGDEIEIKTPGGISKYKIIKIEK